MVGIRVPKTQPGARAAFLKLGARTYLVISIVSVAALIDLDAQGRIADAAIAIGACSAVPARLPALERRLAGAAAGAAVGRVTAADVCAPLTPIDDVRGSAQYRRDVAVVLVRRALERCLAPSVEAAA